MSTPNYSWYQGTIGGDSGSWGGSLNSTISSQDTTVKAVSDVANAALPKAGGTMTGRITGLTESMHYSAKGNISGAVSFDASLGQYFSCTVTGAVTSVAFTNLPASGEAYVILLEITNGGSASFTWGSAFKWPSGTAPTLTSSGVDIVCLVTRDAGTTYRMLGVQKALA